MSLIFHYLSLTFCIFEKYEPICYAETMRNTFLKEGLGWGFLLWLIGYVLGIILFMMVPPAILGWVIMPIGIVITLWVLFKKIKSQSLSDYFILGGIWTVIAILLDYFLLVKLFKPVGGYYKLDVYLYYILTFALPILVGLKKTNK